MYVHVYTCKHNTETHTYTRTYIHGQTSGTSYSERYEIDRGRVIDRRSTRSRYDYFRRRYRVLGVRKTNRKKRSKEKHNLQFKLCVEERRDVKGVRLRESVRCTCESKKRKWR